MSRTEEILVEASAELRGVAGGLATLIILRRGLKVSLVQAWIVKLRRTADILEKLL